MARVQVAALPAGDHRHADHLAARALAGQVGPQLELRVVAAERRRRRSARRRRDRPASPTDRCPLVPCVPDLDEDVAHAGAVAGVISVRPGHARVRRRRRVLLDEDRLGLLADHQPQARQRRRRPPRARARGSVRPTARRRPRPGRRRCSRPRRSAPRTGHPPAAHVAATAAAGTTVAGLRPAGRRPAPPRARRPGPQVDRRGRARHRPPADGRPARAARRRRRHARAAAGPDR